MTPYTPDWVASCYGVKVGDPCPRVTLPEPTHEERMVRQSQEIERRLAAQVNESEVNEPQSLTVVAT